MSSTEALFTRYYFARPGFQDGTREFHSLCSLHLTPGERVLEIGAGPDNATSRYLAAQAPLFGADVEGSVDENPNLREMRRIGSDGRIGYEAESFALCVSNWTLEHVEDPVTHFREVARLLKPGGHYCFRTPNRFHYVTLAARVTPLRVHERVAAWLRRQSAEEKNCWRTWYRANSERQLKALATAAGLEIRCLQHVEKEPCYGRVSPLAFWPMMMYERIVNRHEWLGWMRSALFGVMRKG